MTALEAEEIRARHGWDRLAMVFGVGRGVSETEALLRIVMTFPSLTFLFTFFFAFTFTFFSCFTSCVHVYLCLPMIHASVYTSFVDRQFTYLVPKPSYVCVASSRTAESVDMKVLIS